MKKAETLEKELRKAPDLPKQVDVKILLAQLDAYEKEKNILLALSSDITKVREKDDLVKIFSSRLKNFFYFSHAVVFLIDHQKNYFFPFLMDAQTHPIKDPRIFNSLFSMRYPFTDPVFSKILDMEIPHTFLLDEVIDLPGISSFIKLNYENGMREVMIAPLKRKMETFGYICIYSDRTEGFPDNFKSVLQGIAPQLSNAVSNIIINDEIKHKEYVNEILLSLSHDMVTVRDREDLLNVINSRLKKLINFTHSAMTVLSDTGETYQAFLTDPESRARRFPEYAEMVRQPVPVRDGIYNLASMSHKPVVFNMRSFDMKTCPLWVRLNYEAGAKEMMIRILPGEDGSRHSIILFSDRENNFGDECTDIIERISSQLATAASNISANEEIINKEKDKSFLLDFSHDIASARTKNDLSASIHGALKKLGRIKGYFIRTINEDGRTMSPFSYHNDIFYSKNPLFKELIVTKIPVSDDITARVLHANKPVPIDFAEEINKGHTDTYEEFWKRLGSKQAAFQKLIGTTLRVGDNTLGILWVITDKMNITILEGMCAQISVAISNIRANEEIASKEEEKSILLSLSDGIAALRSRDDLFQVVSSKLKVLFSIKEFGIAQMNEDHTYNSFVLDFESSKRTHPDFAKLTSAKYPITDRVFSSIMNSEDLVIFDVNKLSEEPEIPAYVGFWKTVGFRYVLGIALRVGGKIIGGAFFHFDSNEEPRMKTNLLKAVFAQLAVAVSNILANEQLLSYKQMLEVENDHLKEQIKTIYNFSDIIGSGPEMQKVYQMMSLVAESNSTVLLAGETGTGKELIARAIHNASLRKNKLMVKVNCAALPANLIESELFGHERGSFTGAIERRIGKFELANNSTLFLDEIGEMPLETQVKLLRVIQERELERVGGTGTIKVNVRIIAATNRNLEEEVNAGRFRSDLYYRLNVFPIILPPLRDRLEDVAPLAHYFLERYSKNTGRKVTSISLKAIRDLKSYLWPGNVRELEHLIERSILLTQGNVLKEIQLPEGRNKGENERLNISGKTLEELERSYIVEILKRCSGRIAGSGGAAELLDIPSTTLHSKMKKLHISKEEYSSKQK